MSKPKTYDRDVGKNWHLRFRLIIQELTEELELTQVQLQIAADRDWETLASIFFIVLILITLGC